jgi:hypothetical protein
MTKLVLKFIHSEKLTSNILKYYYAADARELFCGIALGITMYFSTHEAEAITPKLKQLFEDADMVLLEQDFREEDDRNLNLLNELSRGNLLVEDVLRVTGPKGQFHPGFTEGILPIVYRSGKTIILERSPYSLYDVSSQFYPLYLQKFQRMPLAKACRLLAENLVKRATFNKTRDEALAQQLTQVTSQNPSSKILVIRGYGHRPSLEETLIAHGIPFTSVNSDEKISTFFIDEVVQKIIAGGRPTRIELLRSLVEQVKTRATAFLPTLANISAVRNSVAVMSEMQCEKFLKSHANLV